MRLNYKKRSGKGQKVVNEKTVLRIFCSFESLDLNRIEERGDSKSLEVRKFKYRKELIVAELLVHLC